MQRRAITHNGRDWAADLETWAASFDRVLERRDIGKLALPLKSHGYLYEGIVGLADKCEGQAESALEAERRNHRVPGDSTDPQPVATTLQPPVVVPVRRERAPWSRLHRALRRAHGALTATRQRLTPIVRRACTPRDVSPRSNSFARDRVRRARSRASSGARAARPSQRAARGALSDPPCER
jgi:hypothetical protein